tara:strand:- start:351 stop:458 length:108 start_codon:yes stop_codon:yes gene_type:complete
MVLVFIRGIGGADFGTIIPHRLFINLNRSNMGEVL